MPERYEREIEEILRRRPGSQRSVHQRPFFSFHFSTSEWFLIMGMFTGLVAGGYSFLQGGPDLVTALLAVVSMVCVILVVLSQFMASPHN